MPGKTPSPQAEIDFEKAARDYCRRLPLTHFMESVPQSTQRKFFVVSGDLVHAERPDVQTFNELLVQWIRKGRRKPGQVVPDNMVVLCPERIKANISYNLPHQPVGPFWVLDYVSKRNKRKDYKDSGHIYEQELKVPYYLVFHCDDKKLTLYKHNAEKYVPVAANEHGRLPIPELEMEVGLLDGWARFWFRGKLLLTPAEIERELAELRLETKQLREERQALLREAEQIRAGIARDKKLPNRQ